VILIEDDGPLDLAREEEREAEGGVAGLESRWLESVDLATRAGYLRAKGEAESTRWMVLRRRWPRRHRYGRCLVLS